MVSVIIPAYKAMDCLPDCLQGLAEQNYPFGQFEVIVVDNGDNDDIEKLLDLYPWLKIVTEDRPGSYVSRNTGFRHATGDVIVFTDADCLPTPDFLQAGISELQADPECGLVAGHVELQSLDPSRPTAIELYELTFNFMQSKYISEVKCASTANVFTYATAMRESGGFDERLKSTGDFEWSHRVAGLGYRLNYCADAVVCHPTRRSWQAFSKRLRRIAGGQHDSAVIAGQAWRGFLHRLLHALVPVFKTMHIVRSSKLNLMQKIQVFAIMNLANLVEQRERMLLIFLKKDSQRS